MLGPPVQADFLGDVREQLARRLELSDITVPSPLNVDAVAVRYFDFKLRQIPARPRNVVCSREFDANVLRRVHQAGVDAIVEDAIAGRTLMPYLGREWRDLEANDILFNDWRVYHMHLGGREIREDGLVKRAGPLLFCFIRGDAVYMIDIIDHGPRYPTTFATGGLVEILHTNWPTLIAYARTGGSHVRPNDDHSRWLLSRRRGGSYGCLLVETKDGTVYDLIGDGFMMDGRNMAAKIMANSLLTHVFRIEEHFRSSAAQIRVYIGATQGVLLDEIGLELELKHLARGIEIAVRETQSQVSVLKSQTMHFPRTR